MTLTDLMKQSGGNGISVTIGLDDLRQWHEEVLASKREQTEVSTKEKSESDFITPIEVCSMLSVSRSTLTRWQNAGYLVPAKVGGKCLYRQSEIEAILNTKVK